MSDPESAINTSREAEATANQDALVGTRFDNRFEMISCLGSGASGTTYKAKNILLDRIVAVKILHPFLLSNDLAVQRFRQEAQTSSILLHPGIAQVYSHGESPDGRLYMVMDYLDGPSLAQVLATDRKLILERFFNIFAQVIDALRFAHEHGVVHRDIKPENIIITKDGLGEHAIVVDFGIAKLIDGNEQQAATQTSSLLGSSAYMSPEQCTGAAVDARSDIYSLGCTMLECLVGRVPFQGESTFDVMYKHLNESLSELKVLKEIPPALSNMIRKCLEKVPAQRYQNAAALLTDFQKCADMQDTLQRRLENPRKAKLSKISNALVCISTSSVAILLCFFLAGKFMRAHDQVNPTKKVIENIQPEEIKITATVDSIEREVDELDKKERYADSLALLKRWESKFARRDSTPENAIAFVDKQLVLRNVNQRNLPEAKIWLVKLKANADMSSKICAIQQETRIARLEGRPADGITIIDDAMRKYKDEIENYSDQEGLPLFLDIKGDCYADLGNLKKAAELYLQALQISDSNNGGPYFTKNRLRIKTIVMLSRLGKTATIDKLINDCLKAPPRKRQPSGSGDFYLGLAKAFLEAGDEDSYVKYELIAADEFRKNGKAFRQCQLEVVDHWLSKGEPQKALELTKKELASCNDSDLDDKLGLLNTIGAIYDKLNDGKNVSVYANQSLRLINEKLQSDPHYIELHGTNLFGGTITLLVSSKIPENEALAETTCKKWLKTYSSSTSPSLGGLYRTLANVQTNQKKFDEALATCQKYRDYSKRNQSLENIFLADALIARAELEKKQDKASDALVSYKHAIDLPSVDHTRIQRRYLQAQVALLEDKMGKTSEAENYYGALEQEITTDLNLFNEQLNAADIDGLEHAIQFEYVQHRYEKVKSLCANICSELQIKNKYPGADLRPFLLAWGLALQQQHNLSESDKLFNQVISLSPRDPHDSIRRNAANALEKNFRKSSFTRALNRLPGMN